MKTIDKGFAHREASGFFSLKDERGKFKKRA
jgi:hypothetical protein